MANIKFPITDADTMFAIKTIDLKKGSTQIICTNSRLCINKNSKCIWIVLHSRRQSVNAVLLNDRSTNCIQPASNYFNGRDERRSETWQVVLSEMYYCNTQPGQAVCCLSTRLHLKIPNRQEYHLPSRMTHSPGGFLQPQDRPVQYSTR